MDSITSNITESIMTFTLIAGAVFFLFMAFTLYHIIVKDERKKDTGIWVLIVLLFPVLGSIIYWIVYSRDKKRKVFNPFDSQ